MHCRRHGSKPTLALWMLVAVGDVVALVAGIGVLTALLVAGGVGIVVAGVLVLWLLDRRHATQSHQRVSAPIAASAVRGRQA
jgi:cytochrome c-type biogenesis protein CcmH/NrfF